MIRGEVRSCSLADCKLPRYDHRYRGHQDFSCPGAGSEISVGGGEISCFVRFPCSALAGAFGHLASLERLVPHSRLQMRSLQWHLKMHWPPESAPPSLPGGERGSVLVDGAGPSSPRSSIWDTSSRSSPVLGRISVGVGRAHLDRFVSRVWSEKKLLHINLLKMKAMFLALQSFREVVTGRWVTVM